jgi:hypothetical protein
VPEVVKPVEVPGKQNPEDIVIHPVGPEIVKPKPPV